MKVLLVSPNFYPNSGGVESHLIEVMKALSDIKFVVLTNWRPGAERAAALFPTTDFYFVSPSAKSLRKWFAWSKPTMAMHRVIKASFEFLRYWNRRQRLSRIGADLVHFHSMDLDQTSRLLRKVGMIGLMRGLYRRTVEAAGRDVDVLLTDHTIFTAPPQVFPDEAKIALLQSFENIVSVDTKSFEFVKAFQATHPGRLWFIPNSVDTDVFSEAPTIHDGFQVGYAGRIGKTGEEILLEVVEELGDNVAWRFALAGELADAQQWRIARLVPDAEFVFNTDYLRMPQFYSSIDLLLNPFPGEGVGRTTLEAMACGVPVIAVGAGDKYPIRNGETGYLVPPNPKEIARTIMDLKANRKHLRVLGKNARNIILREFSSSVVLPRLRAVYSELSNKRRRQGG